MQENKGVFDTLVVGVPGEDIGQVEDAGAINLILGSASGLTAQGNQGWNQDSPDVMDVAEQYDDFGKALASGDFNGDGWPDLAVGVPGEMIGGKDSAGMIHVFYGNGAGGLTAAGDDAWYQDRPGVPGSSEAGDLFGSALAAGDFNGDGYDDLVIGVPGEDEARGGVHVLYGSASGITTTGNQWWDQDSSGIIGGAEPTDWFGDALTVGDFNDDGYADLAVGIPYEDVTIGSNTYVGAGAVQVLYGSAGGLTSTGNQLWHVGASGIPGTPESRVSFGYALAAGDFNSDGVDDLAIGAPDESVNGKILSGSVRVLKGSSNGLTATGMQIWNSETLGAGRRFRSFGRALTAGDFNGDTYADLAVGVPYQFVGNIAFAGGVQIIYGSPTGLTTDKNQWWDQNSPGIPGGVEEEDYFGTALTAGDFNGDGFADLAIGVPGEDLENVENAGGVQVIYGSRNGLTAAGNQWWDQDSNIEGQVEAGDHFGGALAVLSKAVPQACPNDPYEPNDSLSSPYDASSDFQQYGGLQIMDDAYICPSGDEDYYTFPVAQGETIHISLTSLPADYDLYLYDPSDTPVASSIESGTEDENITYTATEDGWFTIGVLAPYPGSWSGTDGYSLQAYLTGANTPTPAPTSTPSCPNDPYEPNDSFDAPYDASLDFQLDGALSIDNDAYICPANDLDFYAFPVTAYETIHVYLSSLPANYDVFLYDPDGNLVDYSENTGTQDEEIEHLATKSGYYQVRVHGATPSDWSSTDGYSMFLLTTQPLDPTDTPTPTSTPGSPTSTPTPTPPPNPTSTPTPTLTPSGCSDIYEPNEDFNSAILIRPDAHIFSFICTEQDTDWFKFPVHTGLVLDIYLAGMPPGVDYDLWLIDPQGNQVASSTNSGQTDEHIHFTAAMDGLYRVNITSYVGADPLNPYRLELQPNGNTPKPTLYLPLLLDR